MKSFEKNLFKADPYIAGEQPAIDSIKLNANENPYPPSPAVQEVFKNFNSEILKKYPPIDGLELREAIAENFELKAENVFLGNGSDDVLGSSFRAFFNGDKPILFADITYSFYPVWCNLLNIPYENPKVDENFELNADDYKKPNGGIVIANPNAPTSICKPLEFIEYIIKANPESVVIVDEAYIDFGGVSAVSLIPKYENLLVVQTSSKSRSLAGMRVGYALGSKILIDTLFGVKDCYNSYPMDSVALKVMLASVKDKEYFNNTVAKICKTRDNTKEQLRKLGFKVMDSKTNFLFATHPDYSAKEIFEYLKTKKIYVRYFSKPRIDNYLRITVGTDNEMQAMLDALKLFFAK